MSYQSEAALEQQFIDQLKKQGCDCVLWSRKRRAGFVSRQGIYESPLPRPTLDCGTKRPKLVKKF